MLTIFSDAWKQLALQRALGQRYRITLTISIQTLNTQLCALQHLRRKRRRGKYKNEGRKEDEELEDKIRRK
jgi:hypothetical protein